MNPGILQFSNLTQFRAPLGKGIVLCETPKTNMRNNSPCGVFAFYIQLLVLLYVTFLADYSDWGPMNLG